MKEQIKKEMSNAIGSYSNSLTDSIAERCTEIALKYIEQSRQADVSRSKPAVRLGIREIDKMIEELNFAPVLKAQVRQVKWLYNNSNKCTMVYDEKLVRIMIHRLQERIKELEARSEIKFPLPTSVRDGY